MDAAILAPRSPWAVAADILDPGGAAALGAGLWTPQPKQALANDYAEQVEELLYGGAAGGGKTEWGMEHCIQEMVRYPGNRGIIFRRVYPSLNRTVIPRLRQKLHGRATFNKNEGTFSFPNGSVLEVGHLQHEDSVLDYQGAEYGVIFFEEVTEFLESQWEALIARLRAPTAGVRPHAIATTNPGGPGHKWVKRRWIAPKEVDYEGPKPKPLRIWRPKATEENPKPLTRAFVPARLEDNPALLRRDPDYERRLAGITNRGTRRALRSGDWDAIDAVEGALWEQAWLDGGRVPTVVGRAIDLRCVSVDPSDGLEYGDEFGVAVCGRGRDGVGYVEQSHAWHQSPKRMAEGAIRLYYEVGANALVVERNHGGKWLMEVFYSVDPYVNVVEVWASQGKRTRAEPVSALFEPAAHAPRESMRYRARMVGEHPELEEEMTTFTGAPGEVSPNRLDAMVWGLSWLLLGSQASTGRTKDERLKGRR